MLISQNRKQLVLNSALELGEDLTVEKKGKGRKFVSRFIEAGVAHYQEFGTILITKETLDKFIHTMIGCPLIINHKEITDKNADKERVGVISNVWFNDMDGWYYCDGIIWDLQAIDLVKNQGWSVSCTYDFVSDNLEKTHNGQKINMTFIDGEFLHLALVNNPRYERANIVINSKDKVENDKWITVHPNGEDEKGRPLLIKDGETPKEAMQRQWGAEDGQQTLDFKGAKKAVKDAKIYQNKKEASKDKLYKAITDYWEDRTDANEKKLEEAEKEYEKYHDEKIKDYDEFIYDYEEKDEEKRADRRYKEEIKKTIEKREKENVSPKVPKDYKDNVSHYSKDEHRKEIISLYKNIEENKNISEGRKKEDIEKIKYHLKIYEKYPDTSNIQFYGNDRTSEEQKVKEIKKWIIKSTKNNKAQNGKDTILMTVLKDLEKFIKGIVDNACDKKEDEKVENEDKRKIIDEVGGILKDKVDEEVWRTVIGKLEKVAYNPSEDDKADNKCKNEDDEEEEKEEKFEEEKEIAENKKAKNEDKEEKEEDKKEDKADNKCAKNSMDDVKRAIMGGNTKIKTVSSYVSQADRLKAGEQY